ncbi:MAG: phosphoribosylglycinamide formyltransferase [Planctomycetia bacterium]|nr:phosphoribosylglycinamide formyltransferase [Planctomycetia bacterium]
MSMMSIQPCVPVPGRPMRIAVLISGGGRSLENLLTRIGDGRLRGVEISVVISSSPKAGGLRFAENAGIPTHSLVRKHFADDAAYSDAVFSLIRNAGCDLVVLAGFLKLLLVPDDFVGRAINIHPSLMPAFCGKGFHGHFVHEAVLGYGAKISGCTVHFIDNEYDHGPVLLQRSVPVTEEDTPETLAARVFESELESLPLAVQLIADGRVRIDGRICHIRSDE